MQLPKTIGISCDQFVEFEEDAGSTPESKPQAVQPLPENSSSPPDSNPPTTPPAPKS